MDSPKVSVILNTKNEEKNIDNVLTSIKNQTYTNLEIIVVDNNSVDRTKDLAMQYTDQVYNKGPERSPQRNFGAKKASGGWLLFLDADMILDKTVVEEAVSLVSKDNNIDLVVIPERSVGEGFWSAVKSFEKSLYLGDADIEAPRFIRKSLFDKSGGYDESMIASEDWDLTDRLKELGGRIGRIQSFINHNEWRLTLGDTLTKKYYYGKNIKAFFSSKSSKKNRYTLIRSSYLRNWYKFLLKPHLGLGFIVLKSLETTAFLLGYLKTSSPVGKAK